MSSATLRAAKLAAILSLTLSACSDAGETTASTEAFDVETFDETSAVVDHPRFPLVPGTHHEYVGSVNDGDERIERRVVFDVTDLVKVIGGVEAVVIRELDYNDGELVEAELAFFAQDSDGTVWRLGEYPEEYEEGELVDSPAWLTGLDGAVAGIAMKSDPSPSDTTYAQGWGPAVDWTDRAQIAGAEAEVCVPAGCYTDVLLIEEYNPDEPEAWQIKYYATGVGNVKVGWRGDGEVDQEVLELVVDRVLDAGEMDQLRSEALELEASAYVQSPDLYGTTPAATPRA